MNEGKAVRGGARRLRRCPLVPEDDVKAVLLPKVANWCLTSALERIAFALESRMRVVQVFADVDVSAAVENAEVKPCESLLGVTALEDFQALRRPLPRMLRQRSS